MLANKITNKSFLWDCSASLRRPTTQTFQSPFSRFPQVLNDRLWPKITVRCKANTWLR